MAFQAMSWAVEKKCGSASTKLVLLMLANHTNGHTGQCNPSHKRLAEECDMSVSCLKSHLQKLESMGFISIVHRSKDGVMLPNQYVLNLNDKLGGVGQNLAGGGSESGWGVGQNLATETGSIETGIETPPISPTGGECAGDGSPAGKKQRQPKPRFTVPTVDEVNNYCRERNNGISGQVFCDFYASRGWCIGKQPMRDWEAAVRTWENKRKEDAKGQESKQRDRWAGAI